MAYDPNKFKSASPALVNFDFSDIANGTGYETYYLIKSKDNTGSDYHLTPTTDYSSVEKIVISGSGTSDNDYDLTPFVIPRTVSGIVLISIPIWNSTNPNPGPTEYTFELYKWDGSTETILGTAIVYRPVPTAINTADMMYLQMPIDNKLIAVGESLRFRLRAANTSSGNTVNFGLDPAGRADTNLDITTQSKIHVPYKLDS